jgi:glycogen operon protein
MLLMGDELGRSQGGNNNAYCQDNETSWLDWEACAKAEPDLLAFVQAVVGLRAREPAFRRQRYLMGSPNGGGHALKDVYWLAPEGIEMATGAWGEPQRRALGVQIGNDGRGETRFLVLMNAAADPVEFHLPQALPGDGWIPVLDTTLPRGTVKDPAPVPHAGSVHLDGRSLMVLRDAGAKARTG